MKLNHFICPNCGHDFYAEGSCVSCDACQCNFYASQSMTCNQRKSMGSFGYPFTYDPTHINDHFTVNPFHSHSAGGKY